MHPLRALCPILCLTASLTSIVAAADRPLGLVERVDAGQVLLAFDANARLAPGTVVAIYGPGKVVKHPLTKEVIIENRALVAKVQVLSGSDGRFQARVAWKQSEMAIGMDAVPLPNEASPNSPPVLTAAVNEQRAPLQSVVTIRLPIVDPDKDPVFYSWWLEGPAGQVGRLGARTSRSPEITWFTPGLAGGATLRVVARDPLGQELATAVKLQTVPGEADLRKRELQIVQRCGGNDVRLTRLDRDAGGTWWGVEDGRLRTMSTWLKDAPFTLTGDQAPRTAVAVTTWRDAVYVLEANRVSVWGRDGLFRRAQARLEAATDLAVDDDGTLYVADQGSGGVLVYEANGQFRLRLGRAGKGHDSFVGVNRIALGPKGELYALDREQRQVQRFDRFHKRLDTWDIPGDAKVAPVALAVHPRGLLVLLASGQILVYNAKGIAGEAMPPAAESKLCELSEPDSLTVDGSGEIYVAYPRQGRLARYNPQGQVTGVHGAGLWKEQHRLAADGNGRLFGLDPDSGLVTVFDAEGWLVTRFGGNGRKAVFGEAKQLAVSPDGQALAVLDTDRKQVVRFATAAVGDKPVQFGQPGKNNGQFDEPVAIAMDEAGRTYVLDAGLYHVAVFDAQGRFQFNVGKQGKTASELYEPKQVAVSPAGDALYIFDYDKIEVKKFALDHQGQRGTHVATAGGKGDGPGQFRRITGMSCDRSGLLICLDDRREDVQVLDFRGNNAVALGLKKMAELGMRSSQVLAVGPDGQFWAGGPGDLVGARW